MKYNVEIVEYATDKVVNTIDGGTSEKHAEKVGSGININLSEEYFTRIVEEKQNEQ